jgi:hypothetical protein
MIAALELAEAGDESALPTLRKFPRPVGELQMLVAGLMKADHDQAVTSLSVGA